MTASDTGPAVLGLYRAAREFTRRVAGDEALERAALAYARSEGWVPAAEAHDIGIEHAKLSEGIDRAYQHRIDTLERNCETLHLVTVASGKDREEYMAVLAVKIDECRAKSARVAELEAALRYAIESLDKHDVIIAVRHLRGVLG